KRGHRLDVPRRVTRLGDEGEPEQLLVGVRNWCDQEPGLWLGDLRRQGNDEDGDLPESRTEEIDVEPHAGAHRRIADPIRGRSRSNDPFGLVTLRGQAALRHRARLPRKGANRLAKSPPTMIRS